MPRQLIESPSYSERINPDSDHRWSSMHVPRDMETVAITDININTTSNYIVCLEVKYNNNTSAKTYNGLESMEPETKSHCITLAQDDWISKIEDSFISHVLNNIKFDSNKGKTYGPYGSAKRSACSFVIEAPGPNFGLLQFNSHICRQYITSLQVTFASHSLKEGITSLAFLKLDPGTRSAFLRQLLSPIVTLQVGSPAESLFVHENLICKLPFFIAALQGEFREAQTKHIHMPDDDPGVIGALIEYLSTGAYTYASGALEDTGTAAATVDLAQGLFHLRLYAAANKYDCPTLAKSAKEAMHAVLQGLASLDALKIWHEAYGLGLSVVELEKEGLKALKSKMKELFIHHEEEISNTLDESQQLAKDILKVILLED